MTSEGNGLQVIHIISSLGDGGAEAVLYRLVMHDCANRHTVISLMDEGKYGPLLGDAGVRVHTLGLLRGRLGLRALGRLWQIIRSERPDVVQTWMYHADLLGGVATRLVGSRSLVWGIHNSNLKLGTINTTTIAVARINAWLSHLIPQRIICCSKRATEQHQALGYAQSKFRVIPNGYNLSEFYPDRARGAALRRLLDIEEGLPVLGMVARFDSLKDHANLLVALNQLKNRGVKFRCLLVGTGMTAENAEISRTIAEQDLREEIVLLGQRSDIPAVMNALDVHVLSSFGEAFPNVVCEAMACGTPCVVTDVGDCAFIIGDTGWVVDTSNPEALARALEDALHDTRREERVAAAVARIREDFSLERMVEAYSNVWCEVARG